MTEQETIDYVVNCLTNQLNSVSSDQRGEIIKKIVPYLNSTFIVALKLGYELADYEREKW